VQIYTKLSRVTKKTEGTGALMTLWFPENIVRHNDLLEIGGESPYNHIANDIYDALVASRGFGGYTPSAGNPFVTADWVNNEIAVQTLKAAWGRGAATGFTVDNFLGVNTNGTYNGDFGFAGQPRVIVASRCLDLCTDTDAAAVNWDPPGVFFVGFSQNGFTQIDCMNITEFAWLAVGQ